MPSETDLLNDALGQIGAQAITGIDQGTTNANHCRVFYPPLRRSLLRACFWNFAIKRVQLASLPTPPLFEFTYAYALPGDYLRLKNYAGADPNANAIMVWEYPRVRYRPIYKIEGQTLVSNDAQVYIEYITDVTNPNYWTADFYQAVSTWLASKLAMALLKDAKLSESLLKLAEGTLLPAAMATEGQEGSVEPYVVDDFTWGR